MVHTTTHSRTPTSQKMQSTLRAFRGSLIFCSVHLLVPFGVFFLREFSGFDSLSCEGSEEHASRCSRRPFWHISQFLIHQMIITSSHGHGSQNKVPKGRACTQILTRGEADKDDAKAQHLAAVSKPKNKGRIDRRTVDTVQIKAWVSPKARVQQLQEQQRLQQQMQQRRARQVGKVSSFFPRVCIYVCMWPFMTFCIHFLHPFSEPPKFRKMLLTAQFGQPWLLWFIAVTERSKLSPRPSCSCHMFSWSLLKGEHHGASYLFYVGDVQRNSINNKFIWVCYWKWGPNPQW